MEPLPKVVVTKRRAWGNVRYYPENITAKIFTELLGNKTLTESDINKIRELGFEVEIQLSE